MAPAGRLPRREREEGEAMNLCMIGTGGIATQHMKAFRELGRICPRWVISRREEKAREFREKWSFERAGTQLDLALEDPKVNLVVITSPSERHTEQTIRFLQAGKDVIVEIPVGLSLEDAERVAAVAAESGRRVLVCHTMRSFPGIREIRRRVQAGELHLTQIVGYFAIPRRRNQGWAGQRNWIDNLLWHHGCHMVDVAMWVLGAGEVEHISAMCGRIHPEFGMPMETCVHFRTSSNQLVAHALSYNTEGLCWELRCIGEEDVLTYRNGKLLNEKNEDVVPEASWIDLIPQNRQMLATLTRGEPSDYDISSVLAPMKVLHHAQLSAAASPDSVS